MVGEIHLANIYFTDASAFKRRPVLLQKLNSFNDVLFMPLTSNTSIKGIVIDNIHLEDGYIPKTSVVVYEKPGVIATSLLLKKIGTLNQSTYLTIVDELVEFFQK